MPLTSCSGPNYLPTVNRRTVFFSQNQQFDVNPRNASIDGTVYKGQVYAGREDLYQFSYTEMHNKVSCKHAISTGPLSIGDLRSWSSLVDAPSHERLLTQGEAHEGQEGNPLAHGHLI